MGNQQNASLEPVNQSCINKQCLHCGDQLSFDNKSHHIVRCVRCEASYPTLLIGNVYLPLIVEDVDAAIFGWSARLNGFKEKIDLEISNIDSQINNKNNSKLTCKRLRYLARAKNLYRDQLIDLLTSIDSDSNTTNSLANIVIAKNQGVDSYINNIFRDWCWNNGENIELLHAVEEVLPENFIAGKTLTLGAGASRLSYDFHYAFNAVHSVLTDINPVLLGIAANIIEGESLNLYEFPIAPRTLESFAVNQQCEMPQRDNHDASNFEYILADALNSPFMEKSFDTVLTPWFIDIIPIDFREFIPHVNRLLAVGGEWVNTGSLAFFHKDAAWNYSQEEIIDFLKKYGFDNIKVNRSDINYLKSPYSAHGRIENIFSFSARKKFDIKPPEKFNYIPDWLSDVDKNIPAGDELTAMSSKYLLQAQIFSAVDGGRSISEIAKLVAKQYGIPEESAYAAVRQIFLDYLS